MPSVYVLSTCYHGQKMPSKVLSPWDEKVIELIELGYTERRIVLHLARKHKWPHEKEYRAVRRYRRRVRRAITRSPQFLEAQRAQAIAAMWESLPAVTDALIRRAERGRPDAIKLMWEAMGFHNPRVQHEHSGDIEIRLTVPRPVRELPRDSEGSIEGSATEIP